MNIDELSGGHRRSVNVAVELSFLPEVIVPVDENERAGNQVSENETECSTEADPPFHRTAASLRFQRG